jgi:RHS repeat-associated protein
MADQNGVVISRRYFDPFGKTTTQSPSASLLENIRRMTYDLDIAKMQDLDVTNKNRRGFTDHEHLNEQQLIHMNGRVYDYNLGRFMSVDRLIQSPTSTSTQSINPYSYIMNNPLAGTDPTGYEGEAVEKEAFTGSRIKREASVEGGSITAGSSNLTFNGNVTSFISVKFNGIAAGAGDVSKVGSLEGNSAKGGGIGTGATGSGSPGGNGVAGLLSDNVFDNLSNTEQDAVTTLLSHHSQQGRVNESLGSFDSQQKADIAAHNLYNPLSQMVKDEVQWFVVKTEAGYQATFGAIGTLSGKGGSSTGVNVNKMYGVIEKSLGSASIMRSGHTHWDHNNKFSAKDSRYLYNGIKNGYFNKKHVISVSTRDGSYRELNYSRAKDSLNIARPEGQLIRGVEIGG